MTETIHLQLFSNVVQTTDLSGLSAEMKTHYDLTLIDEAGPNLIHDQFGQVRDIPQNGGKIIEFRRYAPFAKALTALTEGVTPDGKSLSVSTQTATVAQYGDYITLSDVLELTAIDKNVVEALKLLGRQAGATLDTVVRNALVGGTNVSYAPKVDADGAVTQVTSRAAMDTTSRLTVDVIQRAVAKLRAQNAPTFGGKYVGIIHPYAAYDLMRDPEWVDAHKYAAPENLFTGEIGEIAGVRFVETTEAKIWRDSTCPAQTGAMPAYYGVFATLILGADAYGVTSVQGGGLETIIKQKGSAGTGDPLDQRSSVGWKALKTAEILVQNYLVRVESVSPVFSGNITTN